MSINNNYVMNFLKYKKLLSKMKMINKKFFHDFYNKNKQLYFILFIKKKNYKKLIFINFFELQFSITENIQKRLNNF